MSGKFKFKPRTKVEIATAIRELTAKLQTSIPDYEKDVIKGSLEALQAKIDGVTLPKKEQLLDRLWYAWYSSLGDNDKDFLCDSMDDYDATAERLKKVHPNLVTSDEAFAHLSGQYFALAWLRGCQWGDFISMMNCHKCSALLRAMPEPHLGSGCRNGDGETRDHFLCDKCNIIYDKPRTSTEIKNALKELLAEERSTKRLRRDNFFNGFLKGKIQTMEHALNAVELEDESVLCDKLWYGRHLCLVEDFMNGKPYAPTAHSSGVVVVTDGNHLNCHPNNLRIVPMRRVPPVLNAKDVKPADNINPGVWERACKEAERIEDEYGKDNLGPYTDYGWGMLHGQLSATRWLGGGEWDSLD
jgi:hypothetical protein